MTPADAVSRIRELWGGDTCPGRESQADAFSNVSGILAQIACSSNVGEKTFVVFFFHPRDSREWMVNKLLVEI